jgi:preprotein translocase subunit SecG
MATVLLIVHLMIATALVGVVLLQRSEGGALGVGGGSGFMTGRGTANFLTRVTASLAAAFFFTSLVLTLIAARSERPRSIFETPAPPASSGAATPGTPAAPGPGANEAPARGGILDKLAPAGPRVPQSQ